MISAGDFRNGVTLEIDGNVVQIIEFQHVKPGKGAAFVRTKLKNVISGGVVEKTFRPTEKFPTAHIDRQEMQYLYADGDLFNFMNMETYDQIELSKDTLGDDAKYLKENLMVNITFYEGEVLGLSLPDKIEYVITHSEPAVKGNTSSGAMKDATLENGMTIKVPLFIEEGETILVTTKDGKYASRA